MKSSTKLHLGSGNNYLYDYLNLDIAPNLYGVEVVHDLSVFPYPFEDNSFEEILSEGCIELIHAPFIKIMEELYRICKDKAIIKIRAPVFPSMNAAQDPLTYKLMTYNTFEYFDPDRGYYYSPVKFKTIKRKYIFSLNKYVNILGFWINWFPTFYTRFLFFYFPANCLYWELEVIKS